MKRCIKFICLLYEKMYKIYKLLRKRSLVKRIFGKKSPFGNIDIWKKYPLEKLSIGKTISLLNI